MSTPSLLRREADVALSRPTLRSKGWLSVAVRPLPKLGLSRALEELVAERVRLAERPMTPLVGARRWLTPARTVVPSLRGPSSWAPSSRLVLDAA